MSLVRLVLLAERQHGAHLEPTLLKAQAAHAEGTLDKASMRTLAPDDDTGGLVNLLARLRDTGKWAEARVLARHMPAIRTEIQDAPLVEPVFTLPPEARLDLPAVVKRPFTDTLAAFSRLIQDADREVLIVAAFAHPSAVEAVGEQLADATCKGVQVRFVTQHPTGTYDPIAAEEALEEAMQVGGRPENFQFIRTDLGAQYSMHAKILVADRERVLVGSANFTGAALAGNVEAGFLVTGKPARQFHALVETLIGT